MWGSDRVRVHGTLLGPETTGPIFLVTGFWLVVGGLVLVCFGSRAWPRPRKTVFVVVGVTGLLFDNCIVDASILQGRWMPCD